MKSIIAILFASVALVACGKKEEAPAPAPAAPVAAPAPVVDATTKQDAQSVPSPAAEPAKKEEAKK